MLCAEAEFPEVSQQQPQVQLGIEPRAVVPAAGPQLAMVEN